MELVKAINKNIEPIQITSEEMVKNAKKKYNRIDIDTSTKVYNMVPTYEMFLQVKEVDIGIKMNLWSSELFEKVKAEFTQKYLM